MTHRAVAAAALLSVAILLGLLSFALAQPARPPEALGRIFAASFQDETKGLGLAELIGQEQANVVRTEDGGATWRILYTFRRETLEGISMMPGGQLGMISGSGAFFRTTNGGRSWNKSRLPFEMSKLRFVGSHGFMVGTPTNARDDAGPTLLVTASKALRWEPRFQQPASVQDHCFSSEAIGWAIDDRGVHQSTDGGRRFTLKKELESSIAVACSDDRHVWVLVGNRVHQSFDAGETWFDHDVGSRSVFTSMQFVDGTHGWLYSDRELRATEDGGNSWTLRMRAMGPPTFWDAQKGWALGGNGDIHHTNDGGRSWTDVRPALAAPAVQGG
ncbi:MAG: hypothetical protein HYY06_28515 [Deltaproteobacteria bacterium]|nr:hypothetical protein [Deltaproteobacteria bacterium]